MKNKYTTFLISAILFVAFLLAAFWNNTGEPEKMQVQIVTFGDSIFGEIRDETAIPVQLEGLLGKSVYNAALGGTCMARTAETVRLDTLRGTLSMVGLVKSVYARDLRVQRAGTYRESMTEYFPEVLEGLEKVDFSKVEMVIIQQGVNDYHGGVPIENPEDPYDEYTFTGALRTTVELLRKCNPNVEIVLVTPGYTWYIQTGKTCEESDFGGGVLEDYVKAEIALAQELGVEVIDMYSDFLPHEHWEDYELYTRDGLHPNEAGRALWAQRLAEELGK